MKCPMFILLSLMIIILTLCCVCMCVNHMLYMYKYIIVCAVSLCIYTAAVHGVYVCPYMTRSPPGWLPEGTVPRGSVCPSLRPDF